MSRPDSCSTCKYATPLNMPNCYLGYLAWHRDADRRAKKGQRQLYCTVCARWRWPDESAACPDAELTPRPPAATE